MYYPRYVTQKLPTTKIQSLLTKMRSENVMKKGSDDDLKRQDVPGLNELGIGVNTFTGKAQTAVLLFDPMGYPNENSNLGKKYRIPRALFASAKLERGRAHVAGVFSTAGDYARHQCQVFTGQTDTMACFEGAENVKTMRVLEVRDE